MNNVVTAPVVLMKAVYDKRLNWTGLYLESCGRMTSPMLMKLAESLLGGGQSVPTQTVFLSPAAAWPAGTNGALPFATAQTVLVPASGTGVEALLPLKATGFRLGLRSAALPDPAMAGLADFVLLPSSAVESVPEKEWRQAVQKGMRVFLAEADSVARFSECAPRGLEFASFGTMVSDGKGQAQDASRMMLMKLLSLVAQDADIEDLEDIFKKEPKLAFELLRLVNSASMGLRSKVANFRQAITILGRRQLQRWLQLLLFAHKKEGDNAPNVMMYRAATRGRMMELLSKSTPAGADSVDYQDEAFMIGVFSLLDVLMGSPLPELIDSLQLADSVVQALLEHQGDLGRMLQLVEQTEALNCAGAAASLAGLGLSPEAFVALQSATLAWVNQVGMGE